MVNVLCGVRRKLCLSASSWLPARIRAVNRALHRDDLGVAGYFPLNSRIRVGHDVVKRLSPGGICVRIQHAPKATPLGIADDFRAPFSVRELDAAQPRH